ncbi:MAG: hypothetical protein GY714_18210 [Desulfobacterales bacterium]|nr:hypothetical protein [Desulfobacterales bacterium]
MRLFKFPKEEVRFECEVEDNKKGCPCGKSTRIIRLSMYENNALLENCGTTTGPKAAIYILRNAMGIAVCEDHIR